MAKKRAKPRPRRQDRRRRGQRSQRSDGAREVSAARERALRARRIAADTANLAKKQREALGEVAEVADVGVGFPIVGIGASAGGLEACSKLLGALPTDTGMAFVLVQHLAPQAESMLAELLSGSTRLLVTQVREGVSIAPNRVYVIPPNTHMGIAGGKLHLVPRPQDQSRHTPIDVFLRSLADFAQSRAIAIILSGTASDGASGVREVKAAGGITFAQEPGSARYDGMPRAAIATGHVDRVLAPEQIAAELVHLSRHPYLRPQGTAAAAGTTPARAARGEPGQPTAPDDHLLRIFMMLRAARGVDFTHYKLPTIRRRLQRRMLLNKVSQIDQYVKLLEHNPAEIGALYQDLLIHVTRFFRDPETFVMLKEKVFPELLAHREGDTPVRIWVPGCATGEEAYSVAIAFLEFLGENAGGIPLQVFATDISDAAIDHARTGAYPEATIAADVNAERLRRFFTKVEGNYRIGKLVRDCCVFARQDLTRDPPFSRVDLILCRNVLIYLGPVLQRRLMGVFHYALRPTGYLLLGSSETVSSSPELFRLVDKKHKLYTRQPGGRVRPEMELTPFGHEGRGGVSRKPEPGGVNLQAEANRMILARFEPASVIVDADMQIIQFRGQTGKYLQPPQGEARMDLLKMAREGLLYDLRKLVHQARTADHPVRRDGVSVKSNGGTTEVDIEIAPLPGRPRHYLVLFEEMAGRGPRGKRRALARRPTPEKGESVSVRRLRQELSASREYLQSIIQDLEATNEELQSANEGILSSNEELQSTNEELDTAREELQSTNEEINTVNEELQSRNEELSRANSDLFNLLSSVQIPIVMVTPDLRIRRFTPSAERALNLIATDVGRPIGDINPNIDCPDLEQLIVESIESVTIKEREVRDRKGNDYLMRIRPYKSVDNRIDGAVVALFDVTAVHGRDRAERALEYVQAIVDTVREPLVVLDGELRVRSVNPSFCRMFDVNAGEAEGQLLYELGDGQWNLPELRSLLEEVLPRDSKFEDFVIRADGQGGSDGSDGKPRLRRDLRLNARRIVGDVNREPLILLAFDSPQRAPGDADQAQSEG